MNGPCWAVGTHETHELPLDRNPAPNRRWSVHASSRFGLDENKDEGPYERPTITGYEISPLQSSQVRGVVFTKNGQVYVDRHSEIPHNIRGEEPARVYKSPSCFCCLFKTDAHHEHRNAWNWQSGEVFPACMAACEVRVAIVINVLPHEA